MARHHKTLLVPGNIVTAALQALTAPYVATAPEILAGPFQEAFNDGHTISVIVRNSNPPQIMATLRHGDVVIETIQVPGHLDQDYAIDNGDTTYELTIARSANTVLTPEAAMQYELSHGFHCPACGSPDIHASRLEADGGTATSAVECMACSAAWKDIYKFSGISTDPEDWTPPASNVPHTV